MQRSKVVKVFALVLITAMLVYAQQPVSITNAPSVAQSGTWNVRNQDGAGNALTTNSTTFTAKFAQDINILGTLGTAFSTAGKVDVKGADGDLFVRQTTGSNLHVVADANASVVIGKVAIDQSVPGTTNGVSFAAGNTISLVPATSGGLAMKHFVAAATDNAGFAKAGAGQVYSVDVYNNATYPVYFKLYNQTTAPATCGSATVVKTIAVQAGVGRSFQAENGLAFSTGIAYCLVKGITDADDTSVVLSDAVVDISYK